MKKHPLLLTAAAVVVLNRPGFDGGSEIPVR